MYDELTQKIREYVVSKQHRSIPFGPATVKDIAETEAQLGFEIPEPLKSIYLRVGNGGFGPGRGGNIIGVKGGYATSSGTIVGQYNDIRNGAKFLGLEWRDRLLPFCEWGCNIFSCIDCVDPNSGLFLAEDCDAELQGYNLEEFVEMWVAGVDILEMKDAHRETAEIINPFTHNRTGMKGRSQK